MPSADRSWPPWERLDVPLAVAVSLLAILLVAVDAPEALRVPVGLAALFLAPGYVLTCALFPRRPLGEPDFEVDAGAGSPMSGAMRFGVAIAMSTALLILAAILVEAVAPLEPLPVLGILSAVTVTAALAWFARLWKAPASPKRPVQPAAPAERTGESRTLSILLLAAIGMAALAGGYALLKPREPPAFTELYLAASDGIQHCLTDRYIRGAYGLPRGQACEDVTPGSLVVGVGNHEGGDRDYWLRAVWTREVLAEDNRTEILEVQVITSWQVTLESVKAPDDPSLHFPQYETDLVLPTPPGNGTWRMSVQLYLEEPPPAVPTHAFLEGPYKHVYLWIEVA